MEGVKQRAITFTQKNGAYSDILLAQAIGHINNLLSECKRLELESADMKQALHIARLEGRREAVEECITIAKGLTFYLPSSYAEDGVLYEGQLIAAIKQKYLKEKI